MLGSTSGLDGCCPAFVKNAKTGNISEPMRLTVQNKYGFHIVLVRSITTEHTINLNDDYKRLEQLALQFKLGNNYQAWVDGLRKTIYWEKKL